MKTEHQYKLQKYTGRLSRHECPQCHDPHSFTLYVDECNDIISNIVGRCDHESECGYHYTPSQWYHDHPTTNNHTYNNVKIQRIIPIRPRQQIDYIPNKYLQQSIGYKSNLVYFFCSLFNKCTLASPVIERLMSDYYLGATQDESVIYWQIDMNRNIRAGKIMKYDRITGHRIRDTDGVNWVHSILKKKGLLPDNFLLSQCLFGEHLLKVYPGKIVALVESEKTALIGSAVFPQYVWLATGGKSQLSIDKMKVLTGRTVIMFPDVDAYQEWAEKSKELTFCKVIVSDLLEKNATQEDRDSKIDLADWLTRALRKDSTAKKELSESERNILSMEQQNPSLKLLINTFGLVAV